MNLICSADGGIPLWFKVGSGNESDSQTFAALMTLFAQQWQAPGLCVVDAAFYGEPNLQQVGSLQWLSRVPQTLGAASGWWPVILNNCRPCPASERAINYGSSSKPTAASSSAGFSSRVDSGLNKKGGSEPLRNRKRPCSGTL
ncbi:MAG: transposase [Leptolyngbyaceae cyanobacterium]